MTTIKTLSFALAVAGAASLTACSKKTDDAPAATKPPAAAPAPAPAPPPPPPPAPAAKDILGVAADAGSFKTLAAAVEAAGLVDTLKGPGPFTVFAPTDDAFAKIPKADLDAILADKAKLTAILTYHVVAGKVMAKDVATMTSAKTVNGAALTIDASNGVKVDGATVVKADVEASNGVIHVIDTVLVPK
ncbi:MAG: fasciclin domain-containing protein [Kofleriaceae bacterium]